MMNIIIGTILYLTEAHFFSALFGLGLAKEAYDKISGRGTVEFADLLATMAGGLIGAGIFLGGA